MAVVKVRKNVYYLEKKSNSELLDAKDEAKYLKDLWANSPRIANKWRNKISDIDGILARRGVGE